MLYFKIMAAENKTMEAQNAVFNKCTIGVGYKYV